MESKKFGTYCKISDFIKYKDETLYEIMLNTCSIWGLSSSNKPGITFIMPQKDTDVYKKIIDNAYSSNIDQVKIATDLINANIIKLNLKDTSSWKNVKGDIPNSLNPSQKVIFEKVEKDKVHLKNAVIELDTEFVDNSQYKNLSVWKLIKGQIPVTTDNPAEVTKFKKGSEEQSDKKQLPEKISTAMRSKIIIEIHKKFIESKSSKDIYIEYIYGLVNFIIDNDLKLFYNKIAPILSGEHFDIYLLLEPYEKNEYLIPNKYIESWYKSSDNLCKNLEETKSKMDKMIIEHESDSCAFYSKRQELFETIRNIISNLNELITDAKSLPDKIINLYKKFEETNTLEFGNAKIENVYPKELHEYYKSHKGLKLTIDECRYVSKLSYDSLNEMTFNSGDFAELITLIGEYMSMNKTKLIVNPVIKSIIKPVEKVNELMIFVNSTGFLYMNRTKEEMSSMSEKNVETKPKDFSVFFNVYKKIIDNHCNIESTNEDLYDELRKLGKDNEEINKLVIKYKLK